MRCGIALALAALAFLPAAARAQFYDLDGAYRCITEPDPSCIEQPAKRPAPLPLAEPDRPLAPSLDDIVARVKQRAVTPDDLRFLAARVEAKDPRATEVLAWCRLSGIGGAPDPVAAYLLYRAAAELGVANARRNQIAIYETRLTSEQRQQVLLKEDAR